MTRNGTLSGWPECGHRQPRSYAHRHTCFWEHVFMRMIRRPTILLCVLCSFIPTTSRAQRRQQNLTPEEREKLIEKRTAIERELESVGIIDRKVMVPMRDGKRMAADIYRPKDTSSELDAVKRGYVLIEMNERGHFWELRDSRRTAHGLRR